MEWGHSHSKVLCKEQSSFPAQAAAIFLISLLKTPDAKASKVTATARSTASSSPNHPKSVDKAVVLTSHSKAFSNMVDRPSSPVSPLSHLSDSERNQAFYSKYVVLDVPSIPSASPCPPPPPTSMPSPDLSLCSFSSGSPKSSWGQSS